MNWPKLNLDNYNKLYEFIDINDEAMPQVNHIDFSMQTLL